MKDDPDRLGPYWEAIKAYKPIEHVDVRADYGAMLFQVRLPEQIVVLESGELVTLPKATVEGVFTVDELYSIDATKFPYYLWQEVRK